MLQINNEKHIDTWRHINFFENTFDIKLEEISERLMSTGILSQPLQ